MHRVLLTYYDSVRWDRRLSEAELVERFCAELENAAFPDHYQRELYQEKGIEELRQFVAAALRIEPDVLHTEERFSVMVGPTKLVGRIDRIDRGRGDSVVITDTRPAAPDHKRTRMKACSSESMHWQRAKAGDTRRSAWSFTTWKGIPQSAPSVVT